MKSLIFLGLTAAMLGALSPPAWASCAPPLPPEEAMAQTKVAFVGTVVGLKDGDARHAFVRVEEVRKGGWLPGQVEVLGSPVVGEERRLTSIDRRYVVGGRYLFVPHNDASPFQDNVCTATTLLGTSGRPAAGGSGAATTTTGGNPADREAASTLPWLLVGGATLLAVAVALFVVRTRRAVGT